MTKISKTTKTSGSKKLVFFGNERLATGVSTDAPTLRKLIENGYDIVAVVSNFERGLSRSARDLEIADVAKTHDIPLLLPGKPSEIKGTLEQSGAEAAVLVAYGRIVPQEIIDIFPKGIINIHPSLLPLHRGPTPIESVMLEGAAATGVSLMQLVRQMDAGPVYAQTSVPLRGDETKQQLADTLLQVGGDMLITHLPDILAGTLSPVPQDEAEATYDNLISKEDGSIDWSKPAVRLAREIRAYAVWPKSKIKIAGVDVVITSAAAVNQQMTEPGKVIAEGKQLLAGTGSGTLRIEQLKPAGKADMPAAAFLAGYGKNL